jgi:secondary thiamine-phosphate synthase enzyme
MPNSASARNLTNLENSLKLVNQMKLFHKALQFVTKKGLQLIDITEKVQRVARQSKIRNGLVLVFAQHTTAAVKINENEPCLLDDLRKFLQKLAPQDEYYKHNDFKIRTKNMCNGECANAHSHCQQVVLGTSETIPLVEGKLVLGQWQRIFLIELDRSRKRQVSIQILGS